MSNRIIHPSLTSHPRGVLVERFRSSAIITVITDDGKTRRYNIQGDNLEYIDDPEE